METYEIKVEVFKRASVFIIFCIKTEQIKNPFFHKNCFLLKLQQLSQVISGVNDLKAGQ